MATQNKEAIPTSDLMQYAKPYARIGLIISLLSILIASIIASYNLTGNVSFYGIIQAQLQNPILWILNLLLVAIAFWGRTFCFKLTYKAESILQDKTEAFRNANSDLAIKLKYESNYDTVTKLPNQNQLITKIDQAISQASSVELVALIVLTIKGFKEISYNFGEYNANIVLEQFAKQLKKILVQPFMLDTKMGMSFAANIHGNEFAILIPQLSKEKNVEALLLDLVTAAEVNCMIDGNQITIRPIISAVLYPLHGENAETLLHKAKVASFYAQKEGIDQVIYQPSMEDSMIISKTMLDELKQAIDNDNLEVYYQPNIELSTGRIIGAEALIRFDNPEFGLLQADKLIPLVEGLNLIKQLTAFVLKGVIYQLGIWRDEGYNIAVSINLSAADVIDPELPKQINKLLQEASLPVDCLKVELSERACLHDQVKSKIVLQALDDLGIKIAIEDFCSGHASFGYLMNFPISEVKIDKSFVMNMMKDPHKLIMVKAIVELAHIMNLKVFAIGVEDQNIMNKLQEIGCLYGQGFYYSKAVNVDTFNRLLRQNTIEMQRNPPN